MWWNTNYYFRRPIQVIAPPDGVSTGHPATVHLDIELKYLNKFLPDYSDTEIVQVINDATPSFVVLPRAVLETPTHIEITFPLQYDLGANAVVENTYYVYHGNPDLNNKPARPVEFLNPWPVQVDTTENVVTFTRPGEHWKEDNTTRRNARVTFMFYGDRVQLIAHRNNHSAIAQVRLDNSPWEDVDLHSPTQTVAMVWSEIGLLPGRHELQIRHSGRMNPSSQGRDLTIEGFEYRKDIRTVDGGEQLDTQRAWSSLMVGV